MAVRAGALETDAVGRGGEVIPTPDQLASAGFHIRKSRRQDGVAYCPNSFVLEVPGGRDVVSTSVEPLWAVARAKWRKRLLALP